jgi:3-oxochol-4-en-24-oyl-CoA dehydrogenase
MSEAAQSDRLDELQLLRDSASRFAAQHGGAARLRRQRDSGIELDRHVWKELADSGFLGLRIPEEFGGLTLPLEHAAVVAEEFGRTLLSGPYVAVASLAASIVSKGDNRALQERLLPAIAAGDLLAAVAWEERTDSIVDLAMLTQATHVSGGVELNGRKRFVRPSSMADGFIIPAMSEQGAAGLYWVPRASPGVQLSTATLADGGFVCDVTLKDVHVGAEATVSAPGSSPCPLRGALDEALILCSAELLGVAGQALGMTLEYLRVRKQFGKPIGSFQALQHRAVNMHIQLQLAEASLESALAAHGEGNALSLSLAASRLKARCSEAALAITREAVQMHGAVGFTDEYDIGLYLKRALVLAAWLGNASQQRRRYASLLADRRREHA